MQMHLIMSLVSLTVNAAPANGFSWVRGFSACSRFKETTAEHNAPSPHKLGRLTLTCCCIMCKMACPLPCETAQMLPKFMTEA